MAKMHPITFCLHLVTNCGPLTVLELLQILGGCLAPQLQLATDGVGQLAEGDSGVPQQALAVPQRLRVMAPLRGAAATQVRQKSRHSEAARGDGDPTVQTEERTEKKAAPCWTYRSTVSNRFNDRDLIARMRHFDPMVRVRTRT
eukprot:7525608-Pyramimonas_sp.AAC.1